MPRNPKLLLLLLVSLTTVVNLSSCVTAERCRAKFPESTYRVTTIVDTTIITSTTSFDTIIRVDSRDTVFVYDATSRIKVKVVRVPGDSIFVRSECPPDTIRIEKIRTETTSERIRNIALNGGKDLYLSIFLLLFAVLVVSLFINSVKK
jgi:hypothetical protein